MTLLEALTWFSVLTTGGLSLVVFVRRPPVPLWPSLFCVMLTSFVWCLGEVWTSFITQAETSYWYGLVLQYTGVLLAPVSWWLFGLRFAEMHGAHLPSRFKAVRTVPLVLAGCFWLALVTNPAHGLFITPHLDARNVFQPIWYIQAFVGYTLMLSVIGLFVFVRHRSSDATVREQLLILLAGSAVPLISNFLYITEIVKADSGLTASGLGVSMVLFFAGIYRDHLFSLSTISMSHLIAHERDGMFLLDRQGRLLHFNPAAAALFDGTTLLPNTDVFALLSRLLRTGEESAPDEQVFRLEGDPPRWLEVQVVPIPGRGGRRLGTGLRLREVTALVEAREQLREQATVLEAILGSAEQGMLVVDSAGEMIFSNRAFQSLWSIPDDEMQRGDAGAVLSRVEAQLEDSEHFLAAFRASGDPAQAESRLEMRLRGGRVAECSSRPLFKDGAVVGRVWSFFDVTDEREATQERDQLEAQMLQAQKMESLGILAGGIAHDFNNLLAGILGNADIVLNMTPPGSEMRAPLLDVVDASQRAAELANQMLAYSGRSRFVIRPFDLSLITRETRHLLEAVISKSAVVELDLAPVPMVEGDPAQIRQVIMNLITNASDALESRPGVIRVSTRVVAVDDAMLAGLQFGDSIETGRYVCLEVSDSGTGMDEETIARIFDPFFTTKFTGRGLGLSAVLGIVRAHHGAIFVDSEPGQGTTIRLLLPPTSREASDPDAPEASRVDESEWRGSGCVLVADDEPPVLRVLKRILEMRGFDVITAENGDEALARFAERADEVVAVVLDMTMPGRGGPETLVELRRAGAQVPIVLASGYSEPDTHEQLQGERPDAFIQKPFSAEALMSTLRRVIESA